MNQAKAIQEDGGAAGAGGAIGASRASLIEKQVAMAISPLVLVGNIHCRVKEKNGVGDEKGEMATTKRK